MVYKNDIPSSSCKIILDRSTPLREADGPILVLIDVYVPALTLRLHSRETALQISENITLFAVCCIYIYIYTCHRQRGPPGFGEYHLYRGCTDQGPGRNLLTLLLVFIEAWTDRLQP